MLCTYKKGELPRLECFHNGIILIVNCLKFVVQIYIIFNKKLFFIKNYVKIFIFEVEKTLIYEKNFRFRPWYK